MGRREGRMEGGGMEEGGRRGGEREEGGGRGKGAVGREEGGRREGGGELTRYNSHSSFTARRSCSNNLKNNSKEINE
jgi:hypothetical protein